MYHLYHLIKYRLSHVVLWSELGDCECRLEHSIEFCMAYPGLVDEALCNKLESRQYGFMGLGLGIHLEYLFIVHKSPVL